MFSALSAHQKSTKNDIDFTLFHLFHGVESFLLIEHMIPSLCLTIKLLPDTSSLEKWLLMIERINEDRRAALQMIEVDKT